MIVEEDYIDADLESPSDALERKIQRLENELARVSGKEDRKVLWTAFGLVALILAFKLFGFDPTIVIVVVPVVVFGGLAYVLYENIREKRNILIRHGLQCPACGYIPRTINAAGVYYSRQCLKCRADLNI